MEDIPLDLKKIIKILRNIDTKEYILNNDRRVSGFNGKDAYDILKNEKIENIQKIMNILIEKEIIVRCTLKDKKNVQINLSKTFSSNENYIWVLEENSSFNLILSIILIFLVLSLVMFQVWPSNIKSKVSLIIYPVLGFFIFIGILGIVRLILFFITYFTHQPGIWLFPNLFADVGFFDSFRPLWCYHGEDVRHVKKDD